MPITDVKVNIIVSVPVSHGDGAVGSFIESIAESATKEALTNEATEIDVISIEAEDCGIDG